MGVCVAKIPFPTMDKKMSCVLKQGDQPRAQLAQEEFSRKYSEAAFLSYYQILIYSYILRNKE